VALLPNLWVKMTQFMTPLRGFKSPPSSGEGAFEASQWLVPDRDTSGDNSIRLMTHQQKAVFTRKFRLNGGRDGQNHPQILVRKRILLWIPETFSYSKRMLEASELRLSTYAILPYIKGLRYYTYGTESGKLTGYDSSPPLLAEIKKLNGELKTLKPYLWAAILVSGEIYNSEGKIIAEYIKGRKNPDQKYCVYTLWSGDEGLLVCVRTLVYTTDREDNQLGLKPRFKCEPQKNVVFSVHQPRWLVPKPGLEQGTEISAMDPLTKEVIKAKPEDNKIKITLPQLDLARVLWIPKDQTKLKIAANF